MQEKATEEQIDFVDGRLMNHTRKIRLGVRFAARHRAAHAASAHHGKDHARRADGHDHTGKDRCGQHAQALDPARNDVGHGQLAWPLRTDPRVVVREGVNARHLTPDDVPHAVSVVTIDVAFISLRLILPSLPPFLEPGGDIVALVKPQFEAGREEVGKHGLVVDPAIHAAVIARVTEAAQAIGLIRTALAPAAIPGATGNQEFFVHLQRAAASDR